MCTLVILRRPDAPWPVIIGANRDEMENRPWRAPARHWPDRPDIVAGFDEEAGGSWLGINDSGVVAAVLNRFGELGSSRDKRSRGELVLEALDHGDASDAADALANLDGRAYRGFNLVIADNRDAYWLRGTGTPTVERFEIEPGCSIITAHDLDDVSTPRIARYLPLFRNAEPPRPDNGMWTSWERLLGDTGEQKSGDPPLAMTIETDQGFATVSSSLIALPSVSLWPAPPIWRFAPGRPDRNAYKTIQLRD